MVACARAETRGSQTENADLHMVIEYAHSRAATAASARQRARDAQRASDETPDARVAAEKMSHAA